MSVFKPTTKTTATKPTYTSTQSKVRTFTPTARRGMDERAMRDWQIANNQARDIINSYNKRVSADEWIPDGDRDMYNNAVETFIATSNKLREYNTMMGHKYSDDDNNQWKQTAVGLRQNVRDTESLYSQYKNEKDFGRYLEEKKAYEKSQREYDDSLKLDTEKAKAEVDRIANVIGIRDELRRLDLEATSLERVGNVGDSVEKLAENRRRRDFLATVLADAEKQHGGREGLEAYYTEKNRLYNLALKNQGTEKLKADAEAVLKSPDLGEYSFMGSSAAQNYINKVSGKSASDRSVSIEKTVSDINNAKISDLISKHMTDDERSVYEYYVGKREFGKADEYMSYLLDSYRQKEAAELYEKRNGTILEPVTAFIGGVDSGALGVVNATLGLAGKDPVQYTTANQYAQGMMRQDDGFVWGTINDLAATTGNMMPSIAVGMINPTAGAITMGLSAGGNKYVEMVEKGYGREQALMTGAAIGALEAVTSKLLSGIGALGGAVTNKAVARAVDGMSSGVARFFTKWGLKMGGEAVEEGLQSVFEPLVENAILGTDNKVDWGEVAYSALLGALSAGVLEGGPLAANTISEARAAKAKYGSTPQRLVSETLEIDPEYRLAQKMQERLDAGKKVSGANLAAMARQSEYVARTGDLTPAKKSKASTRATETADVTENTLTNERGSEAKISPSVKVKNAEGKTVKGEITGVEIEEDKATFTLSTGEKVREDKVTFSTENEELVAKLATTKVSRVKGFSSEAAVAMIKGYDGSVSPSDYNAAINDAYRYGYQGIPSREISSGINTSKIQNKSPLYVAYAEGEKFAKATVVRPSFVSSTSNNGAKGRVYISKDIDESTLNTRQRSEIKALDVVAGGLGININVFESATNDKGEHIGENGRYHRDTRSIDIDLHSGANGSGIMLNTAAHEITHHVREVAADKFKAFADAVFEEIGNKGGSVDSLIASRLDNLREKGRLENLTESEAYDLAYEEVVADAAETMLTDSDALIRLSEKLKTKDKTLWDKIKSFINKLVNDIKSIYKDISPDSLEGSLVRDMSDSAERLQKLWVEGVMAASEVNVERKLTKSYSENETIRYSERDYPIDSDVEKTVNDAFATSKSSMHILSDITPEQNKAINRLVNQTSNDLYRGKYTGGKHKFSNDAIRHIVSEHGDFLREGLRAQLPMKAKDIARHLSALKSNKKPSTMMASRTKQGNPSILTSYEINGYTLYAEEITKSLGRNLPSDLIGHTMYKAPTLSTAAFYATSSAQTQPKRQSTVLCNYYTPKGGVLSSGNFIQNANGEPAQLFYRSKNGIIQQDARAGGLIALSSDAANFTDKSGDIEQGYVRCNKPFYITADNRVFSNSETNLSEKIDELKKKGYDCFIFDRTAGDNYMVAVVNKSQIIKDKPVVISSDEGGVHSDRRSAEDSFSNRALLTSALESVAEHPEERKLLESYKAEVDDLNAAEARLREVQSDLKALTFKKGPRDNAAIELLNKEKGELIKKIDRSDKRLLRLEAMESLKAVMEREKQKAYSRARKKASEALHKNVEGRHKTAERHSIRKIAKDLEKLLNRGTKERNVKKGERALVERLLDITDRLFATDDELLLSGIVTDTSAKEKSAIAEYMALYEEYRSYDDAASENKEIRKELRQKMTEVKHDFAEALERERNRINEAQASDAFDALIKEYKALKGSKEEHLAGAYKAESAEFLETLKETVGDTTIKNMSLKQLQSLHTALTLVKHTISDSNKIFRNGRRESLEERKNAGFAQINNLNNKFNKDYNERIGKLLESINTMGWNNLRPVDAFELLDSEALMELYWDVLDAQNHVYAPDIEEFTKKLVSARQKYGYKKWGIEDSKTFKTDDGRDFALTLGERMSIYAYSKREQAEAHMREGGFQREKGAIYKDEKGIYRLHKKESLTYKIGDKFRLETIASNDFLTKEQRAYVDEMQALLTEWGNKGNEASNIVYGIDLFTESVYFPLVSSSDYLSSVQNELGNTRTTASLSASGMTKPTVPGANNPIMLRSFDDVVMEHIDKMSKYHAYLVPIENLRKMLDAQGESSNGNMLSMRALIGEKLGDGAKKYFQDYITDLNGAPAISGAKSPLASFFSKSKAVKVLGNISVWIQQWFSVIRASAEINPKYLIPFLGDSFKKSDMKLYDEMKKYAPITTIKEMGGFDIGNSGTLKDYVGYLETGKVKGKAWKKFQDALGVGAGFMDKLGWMTIWKSVKKEVATEGKYKSGSDAYFKACGERFERVIAKTQVYDSVNARSAYMRSQNDAVKYLVSFMGEPTTIAGMAEVAAIKYQRALASKNKNKISQAGAKLVATMAAIAASSALTDMAKSIIVALRDDDNDESYWEKYAQALGATFSDSMNPMNYFPVLRDIASIWDGFTTERPDIELIESAITSFKRTMKTIYDEDATSKEKLFAGVDTAMEILNLLGIPFKTIERDVRGIIRTISNIGNGYKSNLGEKFVEGVTGKSQNKNKKLYDAIVSGDDALTNYYRNNYDDNDSYNTALRKALRDNDERVQRIAMAECLGKYSESASLEREIISEGRFDKNVIVGKAIETEVNYVKDKLKEAKDYIKDGKEDEAKAIYKTLKKRGYTMEFIEAYLKKIS